MGRSAAFAVPVEYESRGVSKAGKSFGIGMLGESALNVKWPNATAEHVGGETTFRVARRPSDVKR